MPMSGSVLSAAIRSAIIANSAIQAIDGPALTGLCDAIADAVVAHITSSAVVVTNPGAPLTAPPGGGPVTGTGLVT